MNQQDRTKRKLCGILSADVVGYSRLMEDDEAWTIKSLEENKKLISRLVEEYEGRVVDAPGDNLLAEFSSVINAVECAGKIQQNLKVINRELSENRRMEFRIGVNLGEVVEEDGRIYGSGVNIAARLEGLAKPGGICISRTAYDQVNTKLDLGYEYLGEHNVKNISAPIRVYRVLLEYETAGKVIGEKKFLSALSRKAALYIIFILFIIAAILAGWVVYFHKSEKIEPPPVEIKQASAVTEDETSKTIAVLPFEDLSPDKDQEYFVDGLSEEILNTLTQIPDLTVISSASSFAFKGTNKTIPEIADILGVSNVLGGSVRKSGNDIRITAKLIRAQDSAQLWSKNYNRKFEGIFDIQTDIAASVADELKLTLGIASPPRYAEGSENLKAYEAFLSARGQSSAQGQPFRMEYGRPPEFLRSAIELNPENPDTWVMEAYNHIRQAPMLPSDKVSDELDKAIKAAQKAIELKSDSGQAYMALGQALSSGGNFLDAEKAYQQAIKLSPEIKHSLFLIMHYTQMGYLRQSSELLGTMGKIDPFKPFTDAANILNLGFSNDLTQAEMDYKKGKEIFRNSWISGDLNITILRLGSGKALSKNDIPELPMFEPVWSIGRENIDSPEEGLARLKEQYSSNNNLSSMHLITMSCFAAYFGDQEFAFTTLEKSVKLQTSGLYFIWTPLMQKVRKMPQFKEFVKEIGLVEYWNEYGWPDKCMATGNDDFDCN